MQCLPLLSLSAAMVGCQSGTACDGDQPLPCFTVEGGRYLVVEPTGDAPVASLLWFHGYGGSAAGQADKDWLVEAMRSRSILGVLMDGIDGSWSHVGSPAEARDELAFIDAVVADLDARYDVDPDRRWVSGHSQGGSMAWDAVCYRGRHFTAGFPAAGAFWDPLPDLCPSGPIALRHTHGLADNTVPLEGRPIGTNAHQGNVYDGIGIWRTVNGCAVEPDAVEADGPTTCQIWSSCDAGTELRFCLHDGGHGVPDGWADRNFAWAEDQAR